MKTDTHRRRSTGRIHACTQTPSPEETTLTEETTAAAYGRLSRTPRAADGRGDPASRENNVPGDHKAKPSILRERMHPSVFRSELREEGTFPHIKRYPHHT